MCSIAARTTYPNFIQILTNFSNGTASYNALQAGVERYFSKGLQFQSTFTWSKTLDTATSGNISFGTNELPDPFDLGLQPGHFGAECSFHLGEQRYLHNTDTLA